MVIHPGATTQQTQEPRQSPRFLRTHAYSAALNRRSENVRTVPVIVAELELGNIEAHVFAAELVDKNWAQLSER